MGDVRQKTIHKELKLMKHRKGWDAWQGVPPFQLLNKWAPRLNHIGIIVTIISGIITIFAFMVELIRAIQTAHLWLDTHRVIVLTTFFTAQRVLLLLCLPIVIVLIVTYYLQIQWTPAAKLWRLLNTKLFWASSPQGYTIITTVAITGVVLSGFAYIPESSCLRTGNLLITSNQSASDTEWYRAVYADPGDVIEFNMLVQNACENSEAKNIKVAAFLRSTVASPLIAQVYAFSDNAGSVEASTVIFTTDGSAQAFSYIPGHLMILSPSCPDLCPGPDTISTSDVSVGNLKYGESVQVLWMAHVTNHVTPVQ
jgi:hypothetical protein